MPENIENTALIQLREGRLEYGVFNTNAETFVWQLLRSSEKNKNIKEIISDQLSNYKSFILLPESKVLENCIPDSTKFLITKGNKNLFKGLYPEFNSSIWEVNEQISVKGKIDLKLTEPEINKALRFVFTGKPKKLIISLNNSIFNTLHEKSLFNVLNTAGYKAIDNNVIS